MWIWPLYLHVNQKCDDDDDDDDEENKNVIFGLSYFSESFYLVRHIFSKSGLFDLHDHFGNLVGQIQHIKSAKGHFDLSCIPLFLNVASTSVV